jgi:hypothetical protein
MRYKILIPSLISLLLVAACGPSRPGMAEGSMVYDDLDADVDGYISPYEARANRDIAGKFKQIDQNGDGKINIEEFQAYMGRHRQSPPEEMEIPEPGAAPY